MYWKDIHTHKHASMYTHFIHTHIYAGIHTFMNVNNYTYKCPHSYTLIFTRANTSGLWGRKLFGGYGVQGFIWTVGHI